MDLLTCPAWRCLTTCFLPNPVDAPISPSGVILGKALRIAGIRGGGADDFDVPAELATTFCKRALTV